MKPTNRLPLLALAGPALALASLAPAGGAQGLRVSGPAGASLHVPGVSARADASAPTTMTPARLPDGIPAPPGYQGTAFNFGSLVDISGERIAIAADSAVYVYNMTLGAYEPGAFFTDPYYDTLPFEIYDIALDGDWLAVSHESNVDHELTVATFRFDGVQWVLDNPNITPVLLPAYVVGPLVELHEGILYVSLFFPTVTSLATTIFAAEVATGTVLGNVWTYADETPVALSVGDSPSGATVALTTQSSLTGERIVRAFRDLDLVDLGVVATGSSDEDFGGALAAADDLYWIGAPLADDGAFQGGKVQLYYDDSQGGFGFGGEIWSTQAGDWMGRDLAVDGDTLMISERHADLLVLEPGGGDGVGAVRVVRHDGLGTWSLTGEITHSFDGDYTTPDDYGASIALDGLTLLAGEPGGGGSVSWLTLPGTSQFESQLTPALAGLVGEPFGGALGLTFADYPAALEIGDSIPSGTAFLVLGLFDLSAPFKGGVLLPTPDIVTPLPLDGSGGLLLPFTWSTSGTSSFTLYGQYWIPDIGGPVGFSATPGFSLRQDG